jgi:hypothetical protein
MDLRDRRRWPGNGRGLWCCAQFAVAAGAGEQSLQPEVDGEPDTAGKAAAAPEASPSVAAAGATTAGTSRGLMVAQEEPQSGNGVGVMTGPPQFGELVPHRTDQPTGVGSVGQPARLRSGSTAAVSGPPWAGV